MSADNQQERLEIEWWIVGFVDGEGCFSVTIQRTPSMKHGWQVFPEFVVTQGAKSLEALQTLQEYFRFLKVIHCAQQSKLISQVSVASWK